MTHLNEGLIIGFCWLALFPATSHSEPGPSRETAPSNSVAATARIDSVRVAPLWLKAGAQILQPVTVTIWHAGPETAGSIFFGAFEAGRFLLRSETQTFDIKIPASEQPRIQVMSWKTEGAVQAATNLSLKPPQMREIWLLPHSHVDIGYTDQQKKVAELQAANLEKGMELARASASNSSGMRFKWNVEAAWTVDHFLNHATLAQHDDFIHVVQAG